jgi:hypothetical protein
MIMVLNLCVCEMLVLYSASYYFTSHPVLPLYLLFSWFYGDLSWAVSIFLLSKVLQLYKMYCSQRALYLCLMLAMLDSCKSYIPNFQFFLCFFAWVSIGCKLHYEGLSNIMSYLYRKNP